MLDYLTIGVHELASMSERRMERLVNPGELLFNFVVIISLVSCTFLVVFSLAGS